MNPLKTFVTLVFCLFAVQQMVFSQAVEADTIPSKEEITAYQIETARAHRSAGDQFYTDELYTEAIEEYSKAIDINPYDRIAWYNRALSRHKLKDVPGAIADLNRILALESGFVSAYFLRGSYYYDLEDYRRSKSDFTSIISVRPNSALSYRKRGTVRFQMKDRNGALKDYSESIRLNPRDPIAYHDRAVTRQYLGDKKGAKDDEKKVKELEALMNENN